MYWHCYLCTPHRLLISVSMYAATAAARRSRVECVTRPAGPQPASAAYCGLQVRVHRSTTPVTRTPRPKPGAREPGAPEAIALVRLSPHRQGRRGRLAGTAATVTWTTRAVHASGHHRPGPGPTPPGPATHHGPQRSSRILTVKLTRSSRQSWGTPATSSPPVPPWRRGAATGVGAAREDQRLALDGHYRHRLQASLTPATGTCAFRLLPRACLLRRLAQLAARSA